MLFIISKILKNAKKYEGRDVIKKKIDISKKAIIATSQISTLTALIQKISWLYQVVVKQILMQSLQVPLDFLIIFSRWTLMPKLMVLIQYF